MGAGLRQDYGAAPASGTGQAMEQMNQVIIGDLQTGRGSASNGHCGVDNFTLVDGEKAYTDDAFWLETHRLNRLFLRHNADQLLQGPRQFKNCSACAAKGNPNQTHSKAQTICPSHKSHHLRLQAQQDEHINE